MSDKKRGKVEINGGEVNERISRKTGTGVVEKSRGKRVRKKESVSKNSAKIKIEEKYWKLAIETAKKQPRLAFYSPVASAVLNYWKNIIPRFSISDFLAKIVERDIESRWSQLYNRAVKVFGEEKRRRKT
ncbi:MAG: hypothetical protein QXK95_05110 [Nitrososphaerota archaeon]|nr:hypothetical protein [Candidatus Geocrenenecus dongiae]